MRWIIAIKEIDHWQIANRYDAISVFVPPLHCIFSLFFVCWLFSTYALLMVAHIIISSVSYYNWKKSTGKKINYSVWDGEIQWKKRSSHHSLYQWPRSIVEWQRMKTIDGYAAKWCTWHLENRKWASANAWIEIEKQSWDLPHLN